MFDEKNTRYRWEWDNKYVIFNPLCSENEIRNIHPKIKKVNLVRYSSDKVDKIPKEELKKSLQKHV